jgi:hypothetical protein
MGVHTTYSNTSIEVKRSVKHVLEIFRAVCGDYSNFKASLSMGHAWI